MDMQDRRKYYDNLNGTETDLVDDGEGAYCPDATRQAELVAIPQSTMDSFLLNEAKTAQHATIKAAFLNEMRTGTTPTGLGWDIDARRSGQDDDYQNMKIALARMDRLLPPTYTIKGADNQHYDVTRGELVAIINAIEDKGDAIFTKKEILFASIDAATTIEQVQAVVW